MELDFKAKKRRYWWDEKPWHKLRIYASGYAGEDYPDLRSELQLVALNGQFIWQNTASPTRYFFQQLASEYPGARHIYDMQMGLDGIEFACLDDKEKYITWLILRYPTSPE